MGFCTRSSIRTRYMPPTNYKGSRYSVTADGSTNGRPVQRITVPLDYEKTSSEAERDAAQVWLDKYNPGTRVIEPGLSFGGDTYWTWRL